MKKNKLNKKMIVITSLILMCFLLACKPTPNNNAINQRDYNLLLETYTADQEMSCPDTYQSTFASKDGNVEIHFEANINIPDATKYPVIQINPQPITDDIIQRVVDEFMEGKTGFYPETSMTKSEIEKKLIELQLRIDDKDALFEKYGDEVQVNLAINNLYEFIDEYYGKLEDAPESKNNIQSNFDFRPLEFYWTDDYTLINEELSMTQEQLDDREGNPNINLYLVSDVELSNGQYIRLNVYNELPTSYNNVDNFGLYGMEHYEIHLIKSYDSILEKYPNALTTAYPYNDILKSGNLDEEYPDLKLSLSEAEATARECLTNMGISNVYLANGEIIQEMQTHEESEAMWQAIIANPDIEYIDETERDDKFYLLTFKPMYYDIPLLEANNRFSQEVQYVFPFGFEKIEVRVSNDSIAEFRWINPTEISSIINENVRLLSFDKIIEIAENHMQLKYNLSTIAPVWIESPTYNEDLSRYYGGEIVINEIRLGLGGVSAYNNVNEFMLIPVWNFYGGYEVYGNDTSDDVKEELNVPFLSINAVDGSIIDQIAPIN